MSMVARIETDDNLRAGISFLPKFRMSLPRPPFDQFPHTLSCASGVGYPTPRLTIEVAYFAESEESRPLDSCVSTAKLWLYMLDLSSHAERPSSADVLRFLDTSQTMRTHTAGCDDIQCCLPRYAVSGVVTRIY